MASASIIYKRRKDLCSEPNIIASEPRSLNDLPDEIILTILSHFRPEELCLIIAKVCKRWNTLAKDMVLWKTLSYECDHTSDISRIAEVLTVAPALHLLIVRFRNDVADIVGFLSHIHGNLRKLILEECWLGKDSTGFLANFVSLYPDLEVLSLHRCRQLTSADYRLIPRLQKLSELNLSYCKGLSGETLRLIADSCQHLKKLDLDAVKGIIDDDVIHVIKKLGKQLTSLVLWGHELTDVAYLYLQNCARLQELEVSDCAKLTDRGLLEGIGSLQELTSLRLVLSHYLTAEALSAFLHRTCMTSIVSLNLSSCSCLDDEVLKGIAESCIHLKELAVNSCDNVTDAGIGIVISRCSELRVLELNCLEYITGEGWLALVPSHLPHLRELSLWESKNVRANYLEELVAAVPELNVNK